MSTTNEKLGKYGLHLTKDARAINKILAEINGTAKKHVYKGAADIRKAIEELDESLSTAVDLPRNQIAGIEILLVSGDEMKRYRGAVIRNIVLLRMRKNGWYMVSVDKVDTSPTFSTKPHLLLSKEKDEKAVKKLRSNYVVGDGSFERDRKLAIVEQDRLNIEKWKLEQAEGQHPKSQSPTWCLAMCGGWDSSGSGGFCSDCRELIATDDMPGHR